jgi:photosystem II stability/assembly factor-like uncharacterized protein
MVAIMVSMRLLLVVLLAAGSARAQWEILPSGSTADLRGIDAVGNGVAWASGTQGTVLRTTDGGKSWQRCATPPGAEGLDFRGVQAFDASTAIVMSSGKGPLSRLYKTTDACQSWALLFTNPDPEGFWDALKFVPGSDREAGRVGYLAGDPVRGSFAEFITYNYGGRWDPVAPGVGSLGPARKGEAMFAASNSSLQLLRNTPVIVTGGTTSRLREVALHVKHDPRVSYEFVGGEIPLQHGESAGAFSFESRLGPDSAAEFDAGKFIEKPTHQGDFLVAVGGDYQKPESTQGTAAFSSNGGSDWSPSTTPPHGYRSAVAYDAASKVWITVGPNGTDVSTDDGRNWRALRLDPALGEPADADQHWNALSLPFVVGPHGRIGRLRPLKPGTP